MPLIQKGAQFWDTHERLDAASLADYFADAAPGDSLTDAARAALDTWPRVLATATDPGIGRRGRDEPTDPWGALGATTR